MSGDHNQYQKPEPLPEKSKGALSHEENKRHNKMILDKFYEENAHLYLTPPQREWVGLTNEEIAWLWNLAVEAKLENMPRHFARMVEENLKEKNT